MKAFLNDDFLLQSPTAIKLYHGYAKDLPIIDYHNHLPPDQVASDHRFVNITQAWLDGDHYKWRAMRTNGIGEQYITGKAADQDRFLKWAETVPYTLRNPLYHWTHLELQRYFGITDLLSEKNATSVYENTSAQLQADDRSVRGLLDLMNVEVICTTDDPVDSLGFHRQFSREGRKLKMLPAFRPDKAMACENAAAFTQYVDRLSAVTGKDIRHLEDYLDALKSRHDFFAENGCRLSDHGLPHLYAENFTFNAVKKQFKKLRSGENITPEDQKTFKSALLHWMAIWNHEKGWTQQFHLGPLRNNNSRLLAVAGADAGADSIGDFRQGKALSAFLNKLDKENNLAKTILYNLNPADNELFATMTGNFNDGTLPGKVQWGSAWWFLDQKDGMTQQLNTLSNMGLLSRFVGMLTDSRSFLSFPRHEYFRRILCNLFGQDVENGELPNEEEWIGQTIRNICYFNAKSYFNF